MRWFISFTFILNSKCNPDQDSLYGNITCYPHLSNNVVDELSSKIAEDACKLLDNIVGAYYSPPSISVTLVSVKIALVLRKIWLPKNIKKLHSRC